MIYLSGAVRQELVGMKGVGAMVGYSQGNRADLMGIPWAADNACYSGKYPGDDAYLAWLASTDRTHNLFATAPDVVGDWVGTIKRSAPMLPRIRALGFRAAFILQDGMPDAWIAWDEFDVLFVGGSTAYKLSEDAYRIVRIANARGKWTHMGRVNSLRRLRAATVSGYDSVDGTFVCFGPDQNLPRLKGWLETLRVQLPLAGIG